jgi:ribosomal protein L7/L12
MPSLETRVNAGDRLIVLATSDGLQRIEWGEMLARHWQVHIEKALTRNAVVDGIKLVALITGCSLDTSKNLMSNLPCTLQIKLYKHQAQYLRRELSKVKVLTFLTYDADG